MSQNPLNIHSAVYAAIFVLAFIVRLAYYFFLKEDFFFFGHPSADVDYYQQWAQEILNGNVIGSKTFYGLPLYPYFLAFLYRIGFYQETLVHIYQIILGSLNCCLLVHLTQVIFKNKRIAILSGILSALTYTFIYYDTLLMPVTLIVTLLLSLIILLIKLPRLTSREAGITGLILGLGILADGKFLIFLFLYIAYTFWKMQQNRPVHLRKIVILTLVSLSIMFSTALRNKIVGGDWIVLGAQKGFNFYIGNNPQANGLYQNPDFIRPTHQGQDKDQIIVAQQRANRTLTDAEVSAYWRNQGLSFITQQPYDYLKLTVKKFQLFFTDTEQAYDIGLILQKNYRDAFNFNGMIILLPLAAYGLWLSRRQKGVSHLNLFILSQLVFTLIFFLNHRHRVTVFPIFILYEAMALNHIAISLSQRKWKPFAAITLIMLAYLFCFTPKLIAQEERNYITATKAGSAYEKREDFTRAREYYHIALTARANDTNAMYNLANTYAQENKFQKAITYYQKALTYQPHHIDALYNMAYSLEQINQTQKAIEMYKNVLNLEPTSLDAHYRLALIYDSLKNCSESRFHLNIILKNYPPDAIDKLKNRFQYCL